MMLKEIFEELQRQLLKAAKDYYGDRLVSLVVYGSAARGTQRFDSDLDFLLICDPLPPGRIKRVREFEQVEGALEPMLKGLTQRGCSVDLSPLIKSKNEAAAKSPVFLDMVEDAQILYDKDGFFQDILDQLTKRLAALGAKRVWRGNAWYWDLKPDFKPGEIFDL